MRSSQYSFLEPLDVLFLRSNKLFGEPGSFGFSQMPPWPSVAAGAIRSRILVDDGFDLAGFADNQMPHPDLGTPAKPGSFVLEKFELARLRPGAAPDLLYPVPADMVVSEFNTSDLSVGMLQPTRIEAELTTSYPLPKHPVLSMSQRLKSVFGYWLNANGWADYLAGGPVDVSNCLVKESDLWKYETRVGVGLDPTTRAAATGHLVTTRAVSFAKGVGFLVGVRGANLPTSGLLRFGGDGRAVTVHDLPDFAPPEPDYNKIAKSGRCRLVLTTPGIFSEGWKLPGIDHAFHWQLGDVQADLVAAAAPRADIVGGWDIARGHPKPSLRAVSTGAVYWLENLDATPDALRKLARQGLWPDGQHIIARQAEGFNRFSFAAARLPEN